MKNTWATATLPTVLKSCFGFWEMNWIANVTADVDPRDSTGKPLPFLIYPVVDERRTIWIAWIPSALSS